MTVIHSYPWYISDWRESETRMVLTLEQRGLFRELTDYCYREGSLPDDTDMLLKIAGCTGEEFARSWSAVEPEFPLCDDGRRHNAKVDSVLPELQKWHEKRREAGRKGGISSSAQAKLKRRSSYSLSSTQAIAQAELKPSTTTTTTTSTTTSTCALEDFDELVERLYRRHPKKKNKALIPPVLFAALDKTDFATIDAAHETLCRSEQWTKQGGQFAPKLDEWLADEGWTAVQADEPEPALGFWKEPPRQ